MSQNCKKCIHVHVYQRVGILYIGMASTCPICLNKCIGSELSNVAAISLLDTYITWPTSASIHNRTPRGGKIHCYNDIQIC